MGAHSADLRKFVGEIGACGQDGDVELEREEDSFFGSRLGDRSLLLDLRAKQL